VLFISWPYHQTSDIPIFVYCRLIKAENSSVIFKSLNSLYRKRSLMNYYINGKNIYLFLKFKVAYIMSIIHRLLLM